MKGTIITRRSIAVVGMTLLVLFVTSPSNRMAARAFSIPVRSYTFSKRTIATQVHFPLSNPTQQPQFTASTPSTSTSSSSTRLFATSNSNNNGFFSKLKNAIPFLSNTTDDSRPEIVTRQSQQLQERKDMEQGLQTLFKDAPLPVRILGGMMGKVVAGLVADFSEQQSAVDEHLQVAYACVQQNERVQRALGGSPITTTPPFSQSSRTVSVNGQTTTVLDVAFLVRGPRGQEGVARLSVQNETTQRLVVQVGGEQIAVDMSARARTRTGGSGSSNLFAGSDATQDPVIVEAEIVDKRSNNNNDKRP